MNIKYNVLLAPNTNVIQNSIHFIIPTELKCEILLLSHTTRKGNAPTQELFLNSSPTTIYSFTLKPGN